MFNKTALKKVIFLFSLLTAVILPLSVAQEDEGEKSGKTFETDTIKTEKNDLEITFIAHATLIFNYQEKTIHVDPVGRYADYSKMPKADLILITHEHGDHFDLDALNHITKEDTKIVTTKICEKKLDNVIVMKNGDSKTVLGLKIKAIPAYNIVHKRENGEPYHPRGRGNGYIIKFADKNVYIAGDTENTPEMKKLKDIDIAFLPMNVPYTMTPEMVADAALAFKPKVLYPYHYSRTDPNEIVKLLKDQKDIEVRIRKLR